MSIILVIAQLVIEILKLIFSKSHSDRRTLLARLRAARLKAQQTGDTSDLEKMEHELSS